MNGEPIVRGIRIVTGWPLLAPYGDNRLPGNKNEGEIICYRTDGSKEDPGLQDFGKNAMLVYFPDGIPSKVPDPPLIFEII